MHEGVQENYENLHHRTKDTLSNVIDISLVNKRLNKYSLIIYIVEQADVVP